MKILVGNKGNIDFNLPVSMTKVQIEKFSEFMNSMFDPVIVSYEEDHNFRTDRLGSHAFPREWTKKEIVKLLDVHTNIDGTAEKLGRTWMSVVIKRGELIPDLMKWAKIKEYDLTVGDLSNIIEEYLQDKKDLTKEKRKKKSAETRNKNSLIKEYDYGTKFLKTIEFRTNAGQRQSSDTETAKKTKNRMEEIEVELKEKFDVVL